MHIEQINSGWRPFCFSVAQIYLVLMQESGLIFTGDKEVNTQTGLPTARTFMTVTSHNILMRSQIDFKEELEYCANKHQLSPIAFSVGIQTFIITSKHNKLLAYVKRHLK